LGLRPSNNRGDIRKCFQVTLSIDVPFNDGQQMSKTDSGEKDDQADFASDQSMSEVDGDAIVVQRNFAHRWTDVRDTPASFDQSPHIFGPAALESGDRKACKVLCCIHSLSMLPAQ
jgi:hypothetical protein